MLKQINTAHINSELINLIKVDIKNDIVDHFMNRFENDIVSLEDQDDPMRPSVCREEFRVFLEETIDDSLTVTVVGTKTSVEFTVGNTKKLGFDRELDLNTTDCIKIIGTIMQGVSGEYVLVTDDMAKEMFPKRYSYDLGRTGQAYLMHREKYDRGVELRGWPEKQTWKFSSFKGVPDFFDPIALDMPKYIRKLGAK